MLILFSLNLRGLYISVPLVPSLSLSSSFLYRKKEKEGEPEREPNGNRGEPEWLAVPAGFWVVPGCLGWRFGGVGVPGPAGCRAVLPLLPAIAACRDVGSGIIRAAKLLQPPRWSCSCPIPKRPVLFISSPSCCRGSQCSGAIGCRHHCR